MKKKEKYKGKEGVALMKENSTFLTLFKRMKFSREIFSNWEWLFGVVVCGCCLELLFVVVVCGCCLWLLFVVVVCGKWLLFVVVVCGEWLLFVAVVCGEWLLFVGEPEKLIAAGRDKI